ncbi:hypothetical protein ADEAN_000257900 [Angomonas deanei]|uniref:Uncharacterized protein n=1 Tax=Angomonas deanei TaxID=59799 RepID=A0A7G2C5U3_9TRYP|nr:hypothetical protein ADEAN_000257900 [Angomonas deanei]
MSETQADHKGSATEPEEELPFLARAFNFILTPGSSLTPVMWIIFNVIMLGLFFIWCTFVKEMPDNIHVWAFGVLGLGLCISTNWMMKLVFSAGLDFGSQQEKEKEEKEKEGKGEGNAAETKKDK